MAKVIKSDKCFVDLSAVENSRIVPNVDKTKALATIFSTFDTGISMYNISNVTAGIYPVTVSTGKAVIILFKFGDTGYFVFEYDGSMYICSVGASVGSWVNVTPGKGTTGNMGLVQLVTDISTPISDTDGKALAGSVGYVLAQQIASAADNAKVPIGAAICSSVFTTVADVTTAYGYGGWSALGSITVGSSTIYYYRRAS
jgi:hypothetical protein